MTTNEKLQKILNNYRKFIQFIPLERYIQLRDSLENFNSLDSFIQFISSAVLDREQLIRYFKNQYDIDISSFEPFTLFKQTEKEGLTSIVEKIVSPISFIEKIQERTVEIQSKSIETF